MDICWQEKRPRSIINKTLSNVWRYFFFFWRYLCLSVILIIPRVIINRRPTNILFEIWEIHIIKCTSQTTRIKTLFSSISNVTHKKTMQKWPKDKTLMSLHVTFCFWLLSPKLSTTFVSHPDTSRDLCLPLSFSSHLLILYFEFLTLFLSYENDFWI